MSPVIRISESIYERLQELATPFVDTPASIIERLLDHYEAVKGPKGISRDEASPGGR